MLYPYWVITCNDLREGKAKGSTQDSQSISLFFVRKFNTSRYNVHCSICSGQSTGVIGTIHIRILYLQHSKLRACMHTLKFGLHISKNAVDPCGHVSAVCKRTESKNESRINYCDKWFIAEPGTHVFIHMYIYICTCTWPGVNFSNSTYM